jgi:CysZ protein
VEQILTGEAMNDTGMLDVVKTCPHLRPRMDQAEILSAQGHRLPDPLPDPGSGPDPGTRALVPAQRRMMAIQYVDYPFDNHKIGFITMRDALKQRRESA